MEPNFAIISEHEGDGLIVVKVNTKEATYQGMAWETLGDFGKRKFENMLVLSCLPKKVKVVYA